MIADNIQRDSNLLQVGFTPFSSTYCS